LEKNSNELSSKIIWDNFKTRVICDFTEGDGNCGPCNVAAALREIGIDVGSQSHLRALVGGPRREDGAWWTQDELQRVSDVFGVAVHVLAPFQTSPSPHGHAIHSFFPSSSSSPSWMKRSEWKEIFLVGGDGHFEAALLPRQHASSFGSCVRSLDDWMVRYRDERTNVPVPCPCAFVLTVFRCTEID